MMLHDGPDLLAPRSFFSVSGSVCFGLGGRFLFDLGGRFLFGLGVGFFLTWNLVLWVSEGIEKGASF